MKVKDLTMPELVGIIDDTIACMVSVLCITKTLQEYVRTYPFFLTH